MTERLYISRVISTHSVPFVANSCTLRCDANYLSRGAIRKSTVSLKSQGHPIELHGDSRCQWSGGPYVASFEHGWFRSPGTHTQHARGHTNTSYNYFPRPPPSSPIFSPSLVFRSHVIDAPAKTPSIFRAHGSAICSAHKRMTSLQVVCNIECKSALNPSLATKTPCVLYCPWQWKSMTLRTDMSSFAEISCSQNFIRCFLPYGSEER